MRKKFSGFLCRSKLSSARAQTATVLGRSANEGREQGKPQPLMWFTAKIPRAKQVKQT